MAARQGSGAARGGKSQQRRASDGRKRAKGSGRKKQGDAVEELLERLARSLDRVTKDYVRRCDEILGRFVPRARRSKRAARPTPKKRSKVKADKAPRGE